MDSKAGLTKETTMSLTKETVADKIEVVATEDGIRDQPRSRGLGDVYKRQLLYSTI